MRTLPTAPGTKYLGGSPLPYGGEANICNAAGVLLNPPRARVHAAATTTMSQGSWNGFALDTLDVDTDNFTTGTTPWATYAIPYAGTYEIAAQLSETLSATGNQAGSVALQVLRTAYPSGAGSTLRQTVGDYHATTGSPVPNRGVLLTWTGPLTAGDLLTPQYYCVNPSSVATYESGIGRTFFTIRMVATS